MHRVYDEMGFKDLSVFNLSIFGKGGSFKPSCNHASLAILKNGIFHLVTTENSSSSQWW